MRKLANKLEPFEPTHPGEVVKDEIEFRGISQRRIALEIGVSVSQLNEVLNAKRPMSPQLALLIGAALGIDAAPLLSLQTDYDIISAKRNESFVEKLKKIPRIVAAL